MASTDLLLAHDIGTTGDKATLFDADGRLMASANSGYPTRHPQPGYAEQDPEDWWTAICAATRAIIDAHPDAPRRIAAVSCSGMMNGCVLVDSGGNAVRPALIHADLRSGLQSQQIRKRVDPRWTYERTGHRPAPYYTLSKLAWLAEQEPECIRSARWCIQAKDFAGGRFCGVWGVTDPSDASLTGLADIRRDSWVTDLSDAAGIPPHILPDILPSTAVIGGVTREAAAATGLLDGTPVVLGGGDGACATAGAGVIAPGEAYHYLGSTSWIASAGDTPSSDQKERISTLRGLVPGLYVSYGTVQSAGASIDWFLSAIGVGGSAADGHAAMEALARESPPGARGLVFLPYLQGERAPIWDPNARGVLFGLETSHTRADLARAIYEGVSLALGSILAVFDVLGPPPAEVRALGGGMRSALWRELLAAVYHRPLAVLQHLSEATACGAAIAGGIGVGLFPSWEAARAFAPVAERVAPDPALQEVYARSAGLYASLYPALCGEFAALAELRNR